MSREWEDKHTCPLYIAFFFCSGLGRRHTKGADGSRYQSIFYEPTEPSQPVMSDDVSEDRPQH